MRAYAQRAGACLMLSTMLHSIATGNLLPAAVHTVCVDINPAVVTKLADRGSFQTIGVVTDVGLFVEQLADELERPRGSRPPQRDSSPPSRGTTAGAGREGSHEDTLVGAGVRVARRCSGAARLDLMSAPAASSPPEQAPLRMASRPDTAGAAPPC